jgi:hypothetical protein
MVSQDTHAINFETWMQDQNDYLGMCQAFLAYTERAVLEMRRQNIEDPEFTSLLTRLAIGKNIQSEVGPEGPILIFISNVNQGTWILCEYVVLIAQLINMQELSPAQKAELLNDLLTSPETTKGIIGISLSRAGIYMQIREALAFRRFQLGTNSTQLFEILNPQYFEIINGVILLKKEIADKFELDDSEPTPFAGCPAARIKTSKTSTAASDHAKFIFTEAARVFKPFGVHT